MFAPAEIFKRHGNVETPELYCVFPFRLSSFEKPNAEIGRRTYTDGRFHKLYFGWAQDELNSAYLGMAEETRTHIVDRVFKNTPTLNRVVACNEENIAERTHSRGPRGERRAEGSRCHAAVTPRRRRQRRRQNLLRPLAVFPRGGNYAKLSTSPLG